MARIRIRQAVSLRYPPSVVRSSNLDEHLTVVLLIEIPEGPVLQGDHPGLTANPWQPLLDPFRIDTCPLGDR